MKLGRLCNYHMGRAAIRQYANQPCLAQCLNSVLNVKALVGAFNHEKALIGLVRGCKTLPINRLQH